MGQQLVFVKGPVLKRHPLSRKARGIIRPCKAAVPDQHAARIVLRPLLDRTVDPW